MATKVTIPVELIVPVELIGGISTELQIL